MIGIRGGGWRWCWRMFVAKSFNDLDSLMTLIVYHHKCGWSHNGKDSSIFEDFGVKKTCLLTTWESNVWVVTKWTRF